MKTILGVILGLVALLVAAVIVLPGFIDWNDYKTPIQAQLKALTGRNVVIGGDIHITVLPTPAVVASGVRMANIKGASAADMVRLKSLEVRIALGPLLTGNIQVETVKLVDPIVELERLADGRVNWEFTPTRTEADGSASVPLSGGAGSPFPAAGDGAAIRLDSFHIENGTIIYRDAASGESERIEHLDARLSAESLSGPLDSAGKFTFRGVSLSYEIAIGKVINERTVPVNMVLATPSGGTKVEISGVVVELADAPKFKGKVMGSGKMLSDLLRATGGVPLDRKNPGATIRGLLADAEEDETFLLGIAAEGTRSKVDYWKSGFYRISQQTGLPLTLAFVDAPSRTVGFGPTFAPTGDVRADMDRIRAFYADKRGINPELAGEPRLREE